MTSKRRQPQRTCLGCRQTRDQGDLVRFVRDPNGDVLVDLRSRLPGRGAYTCWTWQCLAQAVQRRQFERAFRQPCRVQDPAELAAGIRAALTRHMLGLLGMGRKSSQLVAGSNAVAAALAARVKPAVVLLARDASTGIAAKIRQKAQKSELTCIELFTKAELGAISGRAEHSVLGIYAGQLAEAFLADLQKYRNISGES